MKILITGGMGFIGKAVTLKLLERGEIESLYILDNLTPKVHGQSPQAHDFGDSRVQFFEGDIRIKEDIEPLLLQSDALIHLAAETGTGESMYKIEHYNEVNISAMASIIDSLTNNPNRLRKLVLASSRAIYGEGKYLCQEHGTIFPDHRLSENMANGDFEVKCPYCNRPSQVAATSEDSLIHPSSFYGITKYVQETMVMTLCPNIGIFPTSLRYQNVYGPGQSLNNSYTGILSIFSNRIRANKDIEIFEDGLESRDFVFIDDVAESTVRALLSDKTNGQIVNVGSGVRESVIYVAKKLRNLLSSNIKIEINGKFRVGDIRHNYADITKMQRLLKFKPKIGTDEGLVRFVDWVKQQDIGHDFFDKAMDEMSQKGLYR